MTMETKRIYTIGYSGFDINEFIKTLKLHNIDGLIDVRSTPASAYFKDYNKQNLEYVLPRQGIHYRNYAIEFGARQEDKIFCPNGFLDFELFAKSEQFKNGLAKLCKAMDMGYIFALMCAEKDPFNCHRTMLVARAFHELGYEVVHLLPNNKSCTQNDIEERLLDKYFPEHNMPDLFTGPIDEEVLLKKAYLQRNAEIGYKIGDV